MAEIRSISAREVLDSRGYPALFVQVETSSGATGSATIPAADPLLRCGARPLFDGDMKRFRGRGALCACRKIENGIADILVGEEIGDQSCIDHLLLALDDTPDKRRLGANTMLAVSIAIARAAAAEAGMELFRYIGGMFVKTLPQPMFTIIGGGELSASPLAFAEILIHFPAFDGCREALAPAVEVYTRFGELLKKQQLVCGVGAFGGWAAKIADAEDLLELLIKTAESSGLTPGKEFCFGINCNAGNFFRDGVYDYRIYHPRGKVVTPEVQLQYVIDLLHHFPIDYIEDPFAACDPGAFAELTALMSPHVLVCGDALYCGSCRRIAAGGRRKLTNSVLIDPVQIGTVTEALAGIAAAQRGKQLVVVGCSACETSDDFIVDLAVGAGAGRIKCGAPVGIEHTGKLDHLAEVEKTV